MRTRRHTVYAPSCAALGLLMLLGALGCLPIEPDKASGPPLAAEWGVVPAPCEVMACWHQPTELVTAVEFVRVGREEGLEEYVRIGPDGAYEVMIVQDGEIVERYEGVLAPAAVAELAGLLHDWETDAQAITVQECPFACGVYEITYAGRTCAWPAGCALVPRALKCVVLKVIDGAPLDRGCVRLEFPDR